MIPRRPGRGYLGLVIGLTVCFLASEHGYQYLQMAYEKVSTVGASFGLIGDLSESDSDTLRNHPSTEGFEDEQIQVLRTITEHCLPKLVCELYANERQEALSEGERSLMSLIGVTTLNIGGPTKYHFAAHMGQLVRGIEGQGCYEFFPQCPFSGEDVRQIARKIKLK